MDRWVALDVGETLIDETRVWATWSEVLGISPFTVMGTLGAMIAQGRDHGDLFVELGVPAWQTLWPEVDRRMGGFLSTDLYPDAIPTLGALRKAGYRLAIVANQPSLRTHELHEAGIEAEVMAMSEELGVSKPDPVFFQRTLELLGDPDPATVAYVGDRVDNDVLPAAAAGMRAVWLRRGPWGTIQQLPPDVAPALVVDSLTELVERLDEAFPAG